MKNRDIVEIFNKLELPDSMEYNSKQFNNSNLWIVKDNKGNCGFMIDKATESSLLKNYVNLDKITKKVWHSKSIKLKDIVMYIHNDNVSPLVFSSSLSVHFQKHIKKTYTVGDFKKALDKIEAMIKKPKYNKNEIIGVWGEFFVINELINNFSSNKKREEIIKGWESPEGRTIIDIKLCESLINIEVKTTTQDSRVHHISSINQLIPNENYNGYLASLCINEGRGSTCNDLKLKILDSLNANQKKIFNERILIRGKDLCNDVKYIFEINSLKEVRYFKFLDVPKPDDKEYMINIKWDIILDNINSKSLEEIL
jgi:hypothetical protein